MNEKDTNFQFSLIKGLYWTVLVILIISLINTALSVSLIDNYIRDNARSNIIDLSAPESMLHNISWNHTSQDIKIINKHSIIYLKKETAIILNSRYEYDKNEFIYCLYGHYNNTTYHIEDMRETEYESTPKTLLYTPCNKTNRYLGTIHSHPTRNSCRLSKLDIYAFGSDEKKVEGLVCGENKFMFYTKDDLRAN